MPASPALADVLSRSDVWRGDSLARAALPGVPSGFAALDAELPAAAELAQGSVMLKIDVEGQELAVLRGARRVLEQARDLVVAFEAHPEVARRTGIDPMACLSHLQSIRPFEIRIAERPDLRPDPQQPLFDQLRPARICNIICCSTR